MAEQKIIQVDESEYAQLRGVVGAVNGMLANPEARKLVLQARKIADPKAVVPEVDAAAPVIAAVEAQNKKLDDFITAQAKRDEERAADEKKREAGTRWAEGQALARRSGYMDDSLKKLEEFMEKRGIFDHEIGIPAFEALHPQPIAPIATMGLNSFDALSPAADDEKDMKALFDSRGEDAGATNSLINKALAEVRGGARI